MEENLGDAVKAFLRQGDAVAQILAPRSGANMTGGQVSALLLIQCLSTCLFPVSNTLKNTG